MADSMHEVREEGERLYEEQKMIVLDKPDQIEAFRLLWIHGRLKLEMKGLRFRISTFGVVKREFGFKGNRQRVFDQYEAMLKEKGILS